MEWAFHPNIVRQNLMVNWTVVRFYPSEKYEFVSWDYSSQMNGKLIQMFQTTNHLMLEVLDSWRKPTYYKHLQAR